MSRRTSGTTARAITLLIGASGLLACGGQIFVHPDGEGGEGGQGGDGGQGAASPTSNGGGGAGPACGRSDDRFDMALYAEDSSEWGCTIGPKTAVGSYAIEGAVIYADAVTITVDSCPPNVACDDFTLTTVDFTAPNLVNLVPVGAFVRIEAEVVAGMSCAHYLTVRNLPEWGGISSPFPSDHIWLAGGDGGLDATPSLPFALSAQSLDCQPEGSGDDYSIRFEAGADLLELRMGEETDWLTEQFPYRARNLRSFESGSLDGGGDWAFWITASPNFDGDF